MTMTYGSTEMVEEGVRAAVFVAVRVEMLVVVGRGVLLPVAVCAPLLDGLADGVMVSVGRAELLVEADADPETDGAEERVPMRLAVFVRVARGDFVVSRVRVELALAP